jgi:uncharacterized protein involved in exopolysaccharide biosynthesis
MAAGQAEVDALHRERSGLLESKVTAETSGIGNEGTDAMRKELYALQLRLEELLSKYTDDHPLVVTTREQVAAAQKILDREARTRQQVTTGPNPEFQQVQLSLLSEGPTLASQRAKAATVEVQLAEARGRLKKLNDDTLRIASLERECALGDSSYRKYAENFEQSRIAQALEMQRISNIRILQPASFEMKPVRPRVALNLALGLLLSLVAGLATALIADLRNRRISAPADLEHALGMPLLASIPRWRSTHAAAQRQEF